MPVPIDPQLPAQLAAAGLGWGLLRRVVGPPADAVGRRLAKSVDEFHLARLVEVFRNAAQKVDEGPGEVNRRVVGKVVEESAWIEDRVIVEYLGGVLASAKTPDGRDDRGAVWTAAVGRLSAYQLRMHYILYTYASRILPGNVESISDGSKLLSAGPIYVPSSMMRTAMAYGPGEDSDSIEAHCLFGLTREGYVGDPTCSGDADFLRTQVPPDFPDNQFPPALQAPNIPEPGWLFWPSQAGVELYMWAHGRGVQPLDAFLDCAFAWEVPEDLGVPDGAILVRDLRVIESRANPAGGDVRQVGD